MSEVEFSGVGAAYGEETVLHDIDLAVAAGEWLGVIGPNGAGKSTLLKVAAGLVPGWGSVRVGSRGLERLSGRERARIVAFVPQSPVIPGGMTVLDYVLLGRNPHVPYWRTETPADVAVANEEIARLDLGSLAARPIASLSGGERQRAVLARALAQRPDVLLLDEPTTGLDLGHQQQFLAAVDELRARLGLVVISAVHDLTLAAQYAERLILLAGGRIAAVGPPGEVLTVERLRRHYDAAVSVLRDEDGRLVVVPRRADGKGAATSSDATGRRRPAGTASPLR